jgi:hypothetical protein
MPLSIQYSDFVFFGLEQRPVLSQKNFIDVGTSHITPIRLFMNGLEQFFISHEAVTVRHKPEFVRSVAKYVD